LCFSGTACSAAASCWAHAPSHGGCVTGLAPPAPASPSSSPPSRREDVSSPARTKEMNQSEEEERTFCVACGPRRRPDAVVRGCVPGCPLRECAKASVRRVRAERTVLRRFWLHPRPWAAMVDYGWSWDSAEGRRIGERFVNSARLSFQTK